VKVHEIAADLADEQDALDRIVAPINETAWSTDTPSPRWNITDQIAHLAYFDMAATTAITDPDRFRSMVDDLMGAAAGGILAVDEFTLGPYRTLGPKGLLVEWREGRVRQAEAAATLSDDTRVTWYGPSMGARSFLTARLMEVWAHGQDIVDALGTTRPPTDRLRHIAQLGVITRAWTYINRKLDPPATDVDVILSAPSGAEWTWGPGNSTDTVTGSALDFCLVVTQRRHVDDTDLAVVGEATRDWLTMAQAFAGPPTDGPGEGSA
jgi:uncharacterized protein (TIGR03084 family)|tara:strand:- start:1072 stop:1869 length:798 start_codon:yes stop_codon:yes gene_type:complete